MDRLLRRSAVLALVLAQALVLVLALALALARAAEWEWAALITIWGHQTAILTGVTLLRQGMFVRPYQDTRLGVVT